MEIIIPLTTGHGLAMPVVQTVFARILRYAIQPLGLACLAALLARIAVFLYLIVYPIANETGNLVSPLLIQSDADYSFYLRSLTVYQGSFSEFFSRIISTFDNPFANLYKFVTSGPILPLLFVVLRYSAENTLPLSLVSLAVGTITAWIWVGWLHRRGVGLVGLLVFALMPNPIWYQINNTLDTYLAFFTALFVVAYLKGSVTRARVSMGFGAGTLAIMAKPNGLPLIIFMLVDIVFYHSTVRRWLKTVFILSAASLIAVFFLFYMTYLISFLESSSHFSFFGVPYVDYLSGMYQALPTVVDLPLSWLSLIGAKALYLTGLRPSYGVTPIEIVAIRSAPGLVLLPGLIWLAAKRPRRESLFILVYLIPPFLGATQERYLLPVMPVVYFYGVLAFAAARQCIGRLVRG